jgi:hypothetical protein
VYAVVEGSSGRVATVNRADKQVALTGEISLTKTPEGYWYGEGLLGSKEEVEGLVGDYQVIVGIAPATEI